MAEEETNLSAAYQMRRQARGAEPPPRQRRWLRRIIWSGGALLTIILVSVAVWLWWSYTHVRAVSAKLSAAVVDVPARVDALLAEKYVKEQDRVSVGQRLLRLDDTELRAALQAAEAALSVSESQHAQAKTDLEMAKATAASDLESARAQEKAAAARCEEARAQLARVRKGARPEDIEAARARLDSAKVMQALRRLEVQQSEELVVEGIDSKHALEMRKAQLAVQTNAVREAELQLQRMLAGPTEDEVAVAEKVLEGRQAELEEAQAQLKLAEAQETRVELAAARVEVAAAQLKEARAQLAARQAVLDKVYVESAVTGTVTRIFPDVGEFCRTGQPVVLVEDESRGFWVNAYVREEDAPLVGVGQSARIKVLAGSRRYVPAEVVQVSEHTQSQDRSADSAQAGQSVQAERVWVKIRPKEALEPGLKHGMTARVVIRVR